MKKTAMNEDQFDDGIKKYSDREFTNLQIK